MADVEVGGLTLYCTNCGRPLVLPVTEPGYVSLVPIDGWEGDPLRCPDCVVDPPEAEPGWTEAEPKVCVWCGHVVLRAENAEQRADARWVHTTCQAEQDGKADELDAAYKRGRRWMRRRTILTALWVAVIVVAVQFVEVVAYGRVFPLHDTGSVACHRVSPPSDSTHLVIDCTIKGR